MIKLIEMIERFPEINETWRIHDTGRGNKNDISRIVGRRLQYISDKPNGFWYGFGTSWLKWCSSEQPDWIGGKLYLIGVDNLNILNINNEKELLNFTIEYGIDMQLNRIVKGSPEEIYFKSVTSVKKQNRNFNRRREINPRNVSIDWKKVANEYDGIEINPMIYKLRLMGLSWYYTWDVAGGCIWKPRNATLTKIGRNLKLYKTFVEKLK